ncbi:MAG: DedA family protein [Thermodesulfovibrionales bacterium]|nr:DedA family protein [Thermodesulfovibrionales bacterium]
MLNTFFNWLVETIWSMGYGGIVFLMFIESTFIPLPSEIVIPPAGYLISQKQMSWFGVIASGTAGSLLGALFNYVIALYLGRPFIIKYGKYFGVSKSHFEKGERFFQAHGSISTFVGRLILGIRHYISFPAGVARMDIKKFCFYTSFGAAIWVWVLAYVGYFIGNNKEKVLAVSKEWSLYAVLACVLLICGYIIWHRKDSKKTANIPGK